MKGILADNDVEGILTTVPLDLALRNLTRSLGSSFIAVQHGAVPAEMICPLVAAGVEQPGQLHGPGDLVNEGGGDGATVRGRGLPSWADWSVRARPGSVQAKKWPGIPFGKRNNLSPLPRGGF